MRNTLMMTICILSFWIGCPGGEATELNGVAPESIGWTVAFRLADGKELSAKRVIEWLKSDIELDAAQKTKLDRGCSKIERNQKRFEQLMAIYEKQSMGIYERIRTARNQGEKKKLQKQAEYLEQQLRQQIKREFGSRHAAGCSEAYYDHQRDLRDLFKELLTAEQKAKWQTSFIERFKTVARAVRIKLKNGKVIAGKQMAYHWEKNNSYYGILVGDEIVKVPVANVAEGRGSVTYGPDAGKAGKG